MDVLMTHYEQRKTLEQSIESLEIQLSEDDTIYVVDGGSADGSFHTLERLNQDDQIELVYRKDGISRGYGRQIAFEESDADIIVAHADLDTVFYPALKQLEETYRRLRSERGNGALLVHGCFVSDTSTIDSAGGWNDLQVHEDKDLWARIDRRANLYRMPVSVIKRHDNFEWDSPVYRLKRVYQNYRDAIRLGIPSTALRQSSKHHESVISRVGSAPLVPIANSRASDMETYGTFADSYPNPSEFHLRELTYPSLSAEGILDHEEIQVPKHLAEYRSNEAYPGKTSYSFAG